MEADSVRFHMISKMLQGIGLICTAIEVRRNRLPAGATRWVRPVRLCLQKGALFIAYFMIFF
jgi:hypothetical protein